MSLEPDLDVANYLAAASPSPSLGAVGVNIFRGPVRPAAPPSVPHQSVFVFSTGGPPPVPYFVVGGDNANFYRANVQVRVRSTAETFSSGQTLALQVRDKLHLADLVGYVSCKVLNSTPMYLGQDDTEHHEFSVNATVWFKQ